MWRTLPWLLLLLPLLAGGCHHKVRAADLAFPDYDHWPAIDEIDHPTDADPMGAHGAASDRTITAPELTDLVAARHPDVLATQAALDEAEALARAAGAWDNPELEGELLFGTEGLEEIETALMFTIPVGGRTIAAHRLARLEVDHARDGLHAAIKEARLHAAGQLARLSHARADLAIWETLADRSAGYADAARLQEAAGLADPVDISLVLGDAARDQRELVRARARCVELDSALRQAAGLAPGDGRLETPALMNLELAETADALIAAAEQHRDRWRAATMDVPQAHQAPQGSGPDRGRGPALRTDLTTHSIGVAVGIPIPVFAPGTGAYRAAVARRDLALSRQQAEARATVAEIRDLVQLVDLRHQGLHALERTALPSSEAALAMAEGRYQASAIDVLKLLAVHRAHASAELERLELLLELQITLIDLERAVGRPVQVEVQGAHEP